MPVPVAETPPEGLDAYWLGVWRGSLKTLKAQGTWAWEQRPLLDEYVFALAHARCARLNDEAKLWGNLVTRAQALADQLVLTPRGRKQIGLKREAEDGEQQDPFAGLDELEQKRRAQTA